MSARYIVKKGDTLYGIAKQHYGSGSKYHDIASHNHLINPHLLHEGQTLDLPPLKPTQSHLRSEKESYVVRYGDTLWKIADKIFDNPNQWSEIARLNDLKNPDQLLIGQPLKLPGASTKPTLKGLKKEQEVVKPNEESKKFNQQPATLIPGNGIFIVSDEINPFNPKLVRKDLPGKQGFQPKNPDSNLTIGRHVMGDNKSKFTSTSTAPFGAKRFKGTRYWIDVELLKRDGVKFYDAKQIELDFKRIEAKYPNDPSILAKVQKGRAFLKMDKEVLIEGPIKPQAVKTGMSMGITRTTQVLQGVAIVMTAQDVGSAAAQSYEEGSIKPLSKEVIRQVGGWSGAWVGSRAGFAGGAFVGIETGPGALISGVIGAIIGGFVGFWGGDWLAGYLDEEEVK